STNRGACNGREMRLSRPLSGTLSNTSWRAECKFRITDGNGVAHGLMGYTAGTQDPEGLLTGCPSWTCGGTGTTANNCTGNTATNQDGIYASIIAFGTNQVPYTYIDQLFNPTIQTYDVAHPSSSTNPPNLGWRIFGHAKHNAGPFYRTPIAASNTGPLPAGYI